ncbi:hypothetical protein PCK1_003015 [Pneumocystis canis]|nr:hypothetical protein PCK1_003015 [Pneumocystis canis]
MISCTLDWVKKVVFASYMFPERTYNDLREIIDSYPSLDLWIENYSFEKQKEEQVIAVKITFSIIFCDNSYHIPVVLWLPLLYPQKAPAVLLVSEKGIITKQNNYVDHNGRFDHPYLTSWNEYSDEFTLTRLCIFLRKTFSKDIPVVLQASNNVIRSSSFVFSKGVSNDHNLLMKPSDIKTFISDSKSKISTKELSPPPLPDKPLDFLVKSNHLLQKDVLVKLSKKEPINILDSPDIDSQSFHLSPLGVDSIQKPPNPVTTQLINQIALVLQENAEKTQKVLAQLLLQVKADREKILCSQTQIEREKTEFIHLKEQCEKNIDILKEKIETSELFIQKYENLEKPLVDDIVMPGNILSKQFYDLISDEKSIEDVIGVLWGMLEKERIDFDTFLKHIRNLTQEQNLAINIDIY